MKKILSLLFLFIALVSCTDEITFKNNTKEMALPFTVSGGSDTIPIETDTEWSVDNDLPEWIELSETSGFGDTTLTVTVSPNDEGKSRVFYIFISLYRHETDDSVETGSLTVCVTQTGE